jgi:hypothetical protein
MTPQEIFAAVTAEFDEPTALLVVSIHAVHLTQKIKQEDLATPGRFEARFRKKARKLLWEIDDALFEMAFAINRELHLYQCCQELGTPTGAIGGCVKKSFRELLAATEAKAARIAPTG